VYVNVIDIHSDFIVQKMVWMPSAIPTAFIVNAIMPWVLKKEYLIQLTILQLVAELRYFAMNSRKQYLQ
jgi:hypothetical protein